MNEKEFATFAMALRSYYPREKILPSDEAMDLWFMELKDIPFNIAQAGLRKWVSSNKWSPSIAEIREMATSITLGEIPDWGEAWKEVQLAIRRYGRYEAKKGIESLSPLTKQAVERIGFNNLCISENESADRANFRMIYEQLAERKKKDAQMPMTLKMLIAKVQNQNLIEDEK